MQGVSAGGQNIFYKLPGMPPSKALSLQRTRIRTIALSQRVRRVGVFGSALPGDDAADCLTTHKRPASVRPQILREAVPA